MPHNGGVATDLAALVAAIGGSTVGIVGVVATARAARRQQETTLDLARAQMRQQFDLAREEKRLTRVEAMYGTLIDWLETTLFNLWQVASEESPDMDEVARLAMVLQPQPTADGPMKSSYLWSHEVADLVADLRPLPQTMVEIVRQIREYQTNDDERYARALANDALIKRQIEEAPDKNDPHIIMLRARPLVYRYESSELENLAEQRNELLTLMVALLEQIRRQVRAELVGVRAGT
jgi:hypothetical protein